MDINTLRPFRHDLSDSFLQGKDALFNTVDALMTETQAKSFPEVSQSLWFERHVKVGVLMHSPCEKSLPTPCPSRMRASGSGLALMQVRLHVLLP